MSVILVAGAWACGDDNGTGPGDTPPVASFTAPTNCVPNTPCSFTSTSTDDKGITAYSWNFGDNTAADPNQNPTHTFAAAGTYTVTLTVTDASGQTNTASNSVVVGSGTTNQPPVASFTAPTCTVNSACGFTDASSDADGTISTWAWNFGDGTPVVNTQNTNHTFEVEGTYQVQLTVTDNLGATNSITVPVTVGPASASQCTTLNETEVDCLLTLTAQSSITLTLTSVECELGGNAVFIPPPDINVAQSVFGNVCNGASTGNQVTLRDESGATLVLPAGFQLHVRLRRGTGTPAPGSPAGNITGTSPTWTLNFDDGGNPGGLGEPDFGDVVVTVQANPA